MPSRKGDPFVFEMLKEREITGQAHRLFIGARRVGMSMSIPTKASPASEVNCVLELRSR